MDLGNVGSLQVGLASPEQIREWSHGEVTKPETINYKTHRPEPDGLFCERIFGPKKDNECRCGKYKKGKHLGQVCGTCGVEVTTSKVRRIRMGHIDLETPIAHFWYYKGIPSRMSIVLDIPQKELEKVLSYALYIVTEDQVLNCKDEMGQPIALKKYQTIRTDDYYELARRNGSQKIKVGMGGETIRNLLKELDLDELSNELRSEIAELSGEDAAKTSTTQQRILKLSKRLDTIEMFRKSDTPPSNMMLEALPVIPPDLRPLLQLEGGRFGTSDLTEFYRKIIYRNNTLKKQKQCGAPSIIINQQKRMLQTAVDALFENSKRAKPFTGSGNRALKSLSDMLRGKQGRFRQNLLGKRVDYSGRSVIVVGPEFKIYQCGVPKDMALELFKPFVIRKLVKDYGGQSPINAAQTFNMTTAEKLVEKGEDPRVWSSLEKVIKGHPVLLNRAPTLHRLGIQAFEPVLVEGKALKLHPLVCTAFNADFDGDQMAIHIPLSVEAQTEARFLMLSVNNLLAPKDGKPITVPTQDMVLGSYYLTFTESDDYTNAPVYRDFDEARKAYDLGIIKLHTPIIVRREADFNGEHITGRIRTTIGRLIFNQAIPQDIGMVDRSKRENALRLEVDELVKKSTLTTIIDNCIKTHGLTKSAVVIDAIKAQGYSFSTKGALTVSVADITIPGIKEKMIRDAEMRVEQLRENCADGLIDDDERYEQTIKVWNSTTDALTEELKKNMSRTNPIYMMSDSGARGSMNQIKQLAGMRGLMSDTSGRTIEIPIKANFREGLDVIEFFISSHGTRKTLSDTALRTADSGYLTRRLVYASQEVVIREMDCGTHRGIEFADIPNPGNKPVVPLADRIRGRYVSDDLADPSTGEIIATRDQLIDDEIIAKIEACGIKQVKVRSVIECESTYGVCAKCYGSNLATNNICNLGEVVGIIAAQSIGEPGTQLTMRTFHTGGIATADNITQGLPRVEELFEARKPKSVAIISELTGTLTVTPKEKKGEVTVTVTADDGETFTVSCLENLLERVKNPDGTVKQPPEPIRTGMRVEKGDTLTQGSKDPHDVMRVMGISAVENYIIEEVQKVYNSQGVKINDRHLEVIVRQMLRKVKVSDAGQTELIAGNTVDNVTFIDVNARAEAEGRAPARGERLLLGITKAVIASESFLSAASFQETTKVLTEAAIKGKIDHLRGLKENVLVGKLIPAGTGLNRYNDITVTGETPVCVTEIRKAQEAIDKSNEERRREEISNAKRLVEKGGRNETIDHEAMSIDENGEMILGSTVSESYGEEYDAEVLESEGITITDENGVREEFMGMPAEEYDEDNPEVDLGGDFENAYGEEEEPLFGYGDEPDDGGLLED
ncbi:MAG: DNA-directed RNA polymerase subunit beta' [Clostridia bacterium]|nr:DNA-directed RNA polymerase subunit beta' [Clostridia bacterium]